MSIHLHDEARRNVVLNAALSAFSRYGFKRVAMDDIAREAGMSRPSLYLIYSNKAAIFQALAEAMAARACEMATAAWPQSAPFYAGLGSAAIALQLDGWRLVKGSPHGNELVADNSAVVGAVLARVDAHFIALIGARLIENGQSDVLAKTIAAALHGIKDKAATEDELLASTFAFSKMVAASFKGHAEGQ
jgi:AcrR family transcriptional regulator